LHLALFSYFGNSVTYAYMGVNIINNKLLGDKMQNNLRLFRTSGGHTAKKLADLAGSEEMRIYFIERGRFRPRLEEATRLASALNSTVDQLFPGFWKETK
jgi:putative transcriptional regulator